MRGTKDVTTKNGRSWGAIKGGSCVNIFKASDICLSGCQKFAGGDWKEDRIEAKEAWIITDLSDTEHDQILNIHDHLDANTLKGFIISMHIVPGRDKSSEPDEDDPKQINLAAIPGKGELIRHQDRYYEVLCSIQSTSYGVAIYARKVRSPEVCFGVAANESSITQKV